METIAIIGAGPAGLAAAYALQKKHIDFDIFDMGKSHLQRDHHKSDDLGIGIGGAGLFSDGKFSFYPSGSKVYELQDKEDLKESYQWICRELEAVGIETIPFPIIQYKNNLSSEVRKKEYPSHFGTLKQRKQLINNFCSYINSDSIYEECEILKIYKNEEKYLVEIHDLIKNINYVKEYYGIILATGKFGNLLVNMENPSQTYEKSFLRYEVGFRIETNSGADFFINNSETDIKYIWKQEFAEIRTFCSCRNGEIRFIPVGKYFGLSGRTDGVTTNYSNFSLLARFDNSKFEYGNAVWKNTMSYLNQNQIAIWESLDSFLFANTSSNRNIHSKSRPWFPNNKFVNSSIAKNVNSILCETLQEATKRLIDVFPQILNQDSVCIFPSIEGTGYYPKVDGNLKIENCRIWCAGDVVGQFRGLIPAFISGYYIGQQFAKNIDD